MYLPYLRGKRHELNALRNLLREGILSERILPIIEPVNIPDTITVVNDFIGQNRNIIVVHNTKVSKGRVRFTEETREAFNNILLNENIRVGHIVNNNSEEELNELVELGVCLDNIVYIHDEFNGYGAYENDVLNLEVSALVTTNENLLNSTTIDERFVLGDYFNKLARNVDYLNVPDEHFSNIHLNYEEYGYCGFSDYSIIGRAYSEDGWAAKAVAIHIVYMDDNDNLMVAHFVSDTNYSTSDQRLKFMEATRHLLDWADENGADTLGIREFRRNYEEDHYPGLGAAKEFAIMNHLEVIGDYLGRVE